MPTPVHFSSLIPKDVSVQSCHFLLDNILFTFTDGPNIPSSYAILFFTASDFTFTTRCNHNWASFLLWLSLFILSVAISLLCPSRILGTYQPGGFIFQYHIFAFSYSSWGSQGKNTEVVCDSLLQWTTFCQALKSRDIPFSHST